MRTPVDRPQALAQTIVDGSNRNMIDCVVDFYPIRPVYMNSAQRLGKTDLYDGSDVYAVRTAPPGWGQPASRSVHGPGIDELLMTQTGAAKSFLHADGQGSIGAASDAAGQLGWYGFYGAWGRTESAVTIAGAVPSQQYTGRETDGGNLYYYRARYYDLLGSRFIQRDPIGLASGQINPYSYVGNDPVNNTDPSGMIAASSAKVFNPNVLEQQKSYVDLSGGGGTINAGAQNLVSKNPETATKSMRSFGDSIRQAQHLREVSGRGV